MSIGENLYALRIEAGMTQIEVGELTGIQNFDVSNYERGKVKSPRIETLIKFAECFGCTLEDIVGYTPRCTSERYVKVSREFENALISAERYANGRKTYIVKETAEYIKSVVPKLSDDTLVVIRRDLLNRYDQDIDDTEWSVLFEAIDDEIAARSNNEV